jgi:type IV secretory pathway VirB10-like protein
MSANPLIDENMSPDKSPGGERLRTGVRRVNNGPLYIGGIAIAGFLLMMALVMIDRANRRQEQEANADKKGGNSSMYAKELTSKYDGYIMPKVPESVEVPKAEPVPELTVPIATANLDTPPAPPTDKGPSVRDQTLEQFRMLKQQMFMEALKAPTGVQVADTRMPAARGNSASATSAANPGDRRAAMLQQLADARRQLNEIKSGDGAINAYKNRIDTMREAGLLPGRGAGAGYNGDNSAPQLIQASTSQQSKNDLGQFAGDQSIDRWKLNSKDEPPRTPFELRAGFVIPATLITGVNSDLPGQIMAQTSSDVYDTPTGRHLLIPQGARLVGTYDSQVAYGQERVLIAWQRIVFPDGRAMDLGAMPGADSAGYAGFQDQVNHHYVRVFGSAVLMSLVTASISYSQNRDNTVGLGYQQTASGALSQALGQQLGMATAQMLMKNLSISPTIEIRPGYRFNVMVSKDLTFSKPYRSFNY